MTTSLRLPLVWLLLGSCVSLLGTSQRVAAQAPAADGGKASRKEAEERFDRGLKLFNEGDNAGALSEFKRAYELVPNPSVLLNMGLTYGAMRRPVEAVEALDSVLANPHGLSPAQVTQANQTRDDQVRRIARLSIVTNVPANVAVDGVEVARTPLDKPLNVSQGTHVVSVAAPDRLPRNREITVAGGEEQRVELELPPTSTAGAQITVSSTLPEVEIAVDGVVVGTTPFSASLTVEPGKRSVTARRPGYVSEERSLELAKAGSGRAEFQLREDATAAPEVRGQLRLALNEPVADVYVDNISRGPYTAALNLPIGTHRLRIERAGFEPFERDVQIAARQSNLVDVQLEATAETRAAHAGSAHAQQTRAWVTIISGAVVGAAGAVVTVVSLGQLSKAHDRYDLLVKHSERFSNEECDPQESTRLLMQRMCTERLNAAADAVDRHEMWRNIGLVAGGVGVAALATGVVMLVVADDPDKYERTPAQSPIALRPWFGPNGAGMQLTRAF